MRILPCGAHALLAECADGAGARALAAEARRRHAGGWAPELADIVPGALTVLLDGLADPALAAREMAAWRPAEVAPHAGALITLDVVYDGPDLAWVAEAWGVAEAEVVEVHTATEHVVAFCGFAPGFAYMTGLGTARAVSRRQTPRARVAAGSVALAGEYTGIYPSDSPGGWRILGHTGESLWDLGAEPPARLTPGTRVRLRAVDGP